METINSICDNCKHFQPIAGGCAAFPAGIPKVIQRENKHDKPLPKQGNKIIYEPIDKDYGK